MRLNPNLKCDDGGLTLGMKILLEGSEEKQSTSYNLYNTYAAAFFSVRRAKKNNIANNNLLTSHGSCLVFIACSLLAITAGRFRSALSPSFRPESRWLSIVWRQ